MTDSQIINKAIKAIKSENPDWKTFDHDDWYGELESAIDAEIWEQDDEDNYELRLEQLVFTGIKKVMKGQRHKCDPYYDDAFNGYDGF